MNDVVVVQGTSQIAELGEGRVVGERENGASFKVKRIFFKIWAIWANFEQLMLNSNILSNSKI